MKKILSTALVALALIGGVSAASAIEVPAPNAPLQDHLNFWSQIGERD